MTGENINSSATATHDEGAEKAVLGILMIDPEATAEARRRLHIEDFYKPLHQSIFNVACYLDDERKPIEPTAILSELTRRGDTKNNNEIAVYLTELFSNAPSAASLQYYAGLVRDTATRRGLATIGTKMQELAAIDGAENPSEIVEKMRSTLDDLAVDRLGTDIPLADEIVSATLEEIEALAKGGAVMGVPTGFGELDVALNGLRPGQMIVIAARPGVGKALALDTPIPTPAGWTTMGELKVGDKVFGRDGKQTTVTAATEVMFNRECFEVKFSDGSTIIADAEHQWVTDTVADRKARRAQNVDLGKVIKPSVTTLDIMQSLVVNGKKNHAVRLTNPIELPEADLHIDPYVFGFEKAKQNKHIPKAYLRSSIQQRRDLLAGLLDTDGSGFTTGRVEYYTTSEQLKNDVFELIMSLGYRANVRLKQVKGRSEASSTAYTISFTPGHKVFRLPYKNEKIMQRSTTSQERLAYRYIISVESVDSVPVRCIQVNNEEHLYLAGQSMIPTHNTALALDIVRHAAFKQKKSVLMFSLEMSKNELMMRALSAEAYVDLQSMKTGQLDDHKWSSLSNAITRMNGSKLGIDDNATVTMTDIRAKARAFQRVHGLDLLVIDYIQLMNSDRRDGSRQQEVSDISRGVKLLAKEFGIPVIALSQLNRGSEQRQDKKPVISDLRESGAIEQDADVVILLHREEMYEKESPRAGEADVIIAKQRSGPQGTVILSWLGKYSRFDNRTIMG